MKKYVTNSAKKVLPDKLTEYLFELVDGASYADIQSFRLKPYEAADGHMAQLIEHTVYLSGYAKEYLVETYSMESLAPLDASVSVYCDKTSYNMSLSDYNAPAINGAKGTLAPWESYGQVMPREG